MALCQTYEEYLAAVASIPDSLADEVAKDYDGVRVSALSREQWNAIYDAPQEGK
jgi:hypothetical protein